MTFLNISSFIIIFISIAASISILLIIHSIKQQIKFYNSPISINRNSKQIKKLIPIKSLSLLLSFFLLLFAFLRPSWGIKTTTTQSKGSDIVFTLDVSKSMNALDMNINHETTDRLTHAKTMISNFIQTNPQHRYSLVIFAGESFVSVPLTLDHQAFNTFLNGVNSNEVSKQGTDLAQALNASIDRFNNPNQDQRGKSIILISDGGDDTTGDYSKFAALAKQQGIKVFTIGIGSKKGVPIPQSQDVFNRIQYKTYQGKTVLTKLNEKPLKDIAIATNGKYFHAQKANDLNQISKELENLQSTTIENHQTSAGEDQYQIFLIIAITIFIIYQISNKIMISKNRKYPNLFKTLKVFQRHSFSKLLQNFFKKRSNLLFIFLTFFLSSCTPSFSYFNSQGINQFNQSNFFQANNLFSKAEQQSKNLKYVAENNISIIDYAQRNYTHARAGFETALKSCEQKADISCSEIYYNYGNTLYRLGEEVKDQNKQKDLWLQAIEAYKNDLKTNSEDLKAQENIDFIKSKLEYQENQKSNNPNNNNSQSDNENNSEEADNQKTPENQSNTKNSNESSKQNETDSNQNAESKQSQNSSSIQSDQAGDNNNSAQNSPNLSQEDNAKLEQYMQQLEKQESQMQDYFKQNPQANSQEQNDPFASFFNDPLMDDSFFKNFFQPPDSNSNERDW